MSLVASRTGAANEILCGRSVAFGWWDGVFVAVIAEQRGEAVEAGCGFGGFGDGGVDGSPRPPVLAVMCP